MQTVLITGGTGLIGRRLTQHLLGKGYRVIILSRKPLRSAEHEHLQYAFWDVKAQKIDEAAVGQADYVVHLAGAGVVDKRWTDAYKKEILESRTLGSRLLMECLNKCNTKVKAVISSSGIGWYGPDKYPAKPFTETDEPFHDFLAQTCVAWENSVTQHNKINTRICRMRTGIVLSNEGGALAEFKKPVTYGFASILGSGRQVISWIHIDDLCRIILFAMEHDSMNGPYNAVAPQPVNNKAFTLLIAKALKGSFFIPVHIPVFLLKLVMGGSSIEVLKSTTVSADKIKQAGFTFLYPTIESALAQLTGRKL